MLVVHSLPLSLLLSILVMYMSVYSFIDGMYILHHSPTCQWLLPKTCVSSVCPLVLFILFHSRRANSLAFLGSVMGIFLTVDELLPDESPVPVSSVSSPVPSLFSSSSPVPVIDEIVSPKPSRNPPPSSSSAIMFLF